MLDFLQNEGYIIKISDTYGTHINICNYDTYQTPDTYRADTGETQVQRLCNGSATQVRTNNNDNNDKNAKNDNNKELFDIFRKAYPGKKRGLDTEYNDFIKKHKDYKQIIPLLPSIIEDQISAKKKELDDTGFTPMWKNLKTWLSQRCWEEEFGKTESKPPTLTYKEMQEILIPMDAQQKIIFQKEYTFEPNNKIYTRK